MTFPFSTLPGLALYAGNVYRNPSALGFKSGERWRGISSQEFLESVRRAGDVLIGLGLKPGERVGISAESSPFWLMADLATLGAGGVTVPLFPNAARETLRHQILDSGMRFLFVGSEDLREAFASLCDPGVRILVFSKRIQEGVPESAVSAQTPGASGRAPLSPESDSSQRESWETRANAVKPDDTATLIYTSGSTGQPKGVELTHGNIISQVQSSRQRFHLDPVSDSAFSFLPLSHIFERMVAYFYVASGVSLHFSEDPKRVSDGLREVRPTLLTVVPRVLEKAYDRILLNTQESGLLDRLAQVAMRRAFERTENSPPTWGDRVYDRLVYRRIRARFGGRLRLLICGSAPLDTRLCRFFLNAGLQVYEGYGLTESSPVLTVNFPGYRKLGTVGKAFPGVELRIAPDGEILARGPNIMKGYFGHPDATRETVDSEGWLCTGDLGRLDSDGYLAITGRKKELFKTANGKYVAPLPLEQALAFDKLVEVAVVVAEGRPFATAVIFPDFDELLAWRAALSEEEDAALSGSFLRSPAVLERYAAIVQAVNENASSWERIYRFVLADTPPTIEGGELTPTMKLRRHVVESKYASKIEAMYTGEHR